MLKGVLKLKSSDFTVPIFSVIQWRLISAPKRVIRKNSGLYGLSSLRLFLLSSLRLNPIHPSRLSSDCLSLYVCLVHSCLLIYFIQTIKFFILFNLDTYSMEIYVHKQICIRMFTGALVTIVKN